MNNEVKRTIMAIGAHADDIEINVGATLLKYHDLGYELVYIMSTNNQYSGNFLAVNFPRFYFTRGENNS